MANDEVSELYLSTQDWKKILRLGAWKTGSLVEFMAPTKNCVRTMAATSASVNRCLLGGPKLIHPEDGSLDDDITIDMARRGIVTAKVPSDDP
jgi:hypothetical protein